MKQVAILYHSAHGHTQHIAERIGEGVTGVGGVVAHLLLAQELVARPDELPTYDGLILGSPTYLGGVSAPLKALMDATGGLWRQQRLRGRLAAGFANWVQMPSKIPVCSLPAALRAASMWAATAASFPACED